MRELILPTLLINVMMFIIGTVLGINPGLVVVSAPGGYVFQLQQSALVFGVIAISIGVSLLGIKVLGSGLSDASVTIINRCVVYFVTWAILSTVSFSFLHLLPLFGDLLYGALTILYAFGVFLGMGEIGSGGDTASQTTGGGSD